MDWFFARFFPGEHSDCEAAYHRELNSLARPAAWMLDFGCGANTDLARYRSEGRRVWGVDVHEHPHLGHADWFHRLSPSGRAPFADGSFDLIGSCWVLEHVKDPAQFLNEVWRLLRPGGSFVSVSINALHYVSLFSRLVGLLPHSFKQRLVQQLYARPIHDTFPTYYRLNSAGQLRRWARASGFMAARINRIENPDYLSFSPALRRAAIVCDYLLGRIHAELGRLYFVVTLHKPINATTVMDRGSRPAAAA